MLLEITCLGLKATTDGSVPYVETSTKTTVSTEFNARLKVD